MRRIFTHIALFTAAALGVSSAAFAAPSTAKAPNEGARLLERVAADAHQIAAAAAELQKLTRDPAATWKQYDRQWNAMQPVVETMRMRLARLDAIASSLTAQQKKALDQAKTLSEKLAWHSSQLGDLVDKVPVDLSAARFKMESKTLLNEAQQIADAAKNGA